MDILKKYLNFEKYLSRKKLFMLVFPLLVAVSLPFLFLKFYKYIDRYVNFFFQIQEDTSNIYSFSVSNIKYETFEIENLLSLISYEESTEEKEKISEIEEETSKEKTNPPNYSITYIYIGKIKKFAIINGKLLTEGDKTSENEKVEKIEKGKVLLVGKWGKRWIKLK